MIRFAIGTTNVPKTSAIESVLSSCPFFSRSECEITHHKVPSGIADMPLSLAELREGAMNRARNIRLSGVEADYYIGMEGGVYQDFVGPEAWLMGIVYIESASGEGYFGYSPHMKVPIRIFERLYDGSNTDLETIMHEVSGLESVGDKNGSFGAWSNDMLTRTDQFALATRCAIVPFFNHFYKI